MESQYRLHRRGQEVITPDGDIASAIATLTTGATFNPVNWSYVRMIDLFVNVKAFGARAMVRRMTPQRFTQPATTPRPKAWR